VDGASQPKVSTALPLTGSNGRSAVKSAHLWPGRSRVIFEKPAYSSSRCAKSSPARPSLCRRPPFRPPVRFRRNAAYMAATSAGVKIAPHFGHSEPCINLCRPKRTAHCNAANNRANQRSNARSTTIRWITSLGFAASIGARASDRVFSQPIRRGRRRPHAQMPLQDVSCRPGRW
jgi:hypothetical protein